MAGAQTQANSESRETNFAAVGKPGGLVKKSALNFIKWVKKVTS
jgi:hypothetical protein